MAGKRKTESKRNGDPKRLKITLEEHSPDRNEGVFEMLPTELIEMLTHSLDMFDRMKLLRLSQHSRELLLTTGLFRPPNNTSQNYRSDFSHFFLLSSQLHDWKSFWFYSSELTSSDRHELFQSSSFLHQLKLYRISTFAGTGEYGFSEDGAKAAKSDLKQPQNVLHRRNGNVLIAEKYRILSVDVHGNISTLAKNPTNIHQYKKIPGNGMEMSALYRPSGLAEGNDGALFVSNSSSHRIVRIKGTEVTEIVSVSTPVEGGTNKTIGRHSQHFERCIHLRENGTLLISDLHTLFKLENGVLHPIAVDGTSVSPFDLSQIPMIVDHAIRTVCEIDGNIFVLGRNTIGRLDEHASYSEKIIWSSPIGVELEFAKAVGERIYFTDSISVKVLQNGVVHQMTGNVVGERNERDGGPASDTLVYFTAGLDVSEELGKIWFVEQKRNVVRVLEAWFDVASSVSCRIFGWK